MQFLSPKCVNIPISSTTVYSHLSEKVFKLALVNCSLKKPMHYWVSPHVSPEKKDVLSLAQLSSASQSMRNKFKDFI